MGNQSKPSAIFLLGPTASGKTRWAIEIIDKFPKTIELISVDSVQVYKGCNVGSGKPDQNTLKKYPHHLIDRCSVSEIYNVAEFINDASSLAKKIVDNGRVPLFVGGTMMYFKSLFEGIYSLPNADYVLRKKLDAELKENGPKKLFDQLVKLNKAKAREISPNDKQRLIRAIEIELSQNNQDKDLAKLGIRNEFNIIQIGIFPSQRTELHERIEKRQPILVNDKLINELEELIVNNNLEKTHPILKAVNYKQAFMVLNDLLNKSEMLEKSVFGTRQLAKRQITWMRSWKGLNFFDLYEQDAATEFIKKGLKL